MHLKKLPYFSNIDIRQQEEEVNNLKEIIKQMPAYYVIKTRFRNYYF